MELKRIVVAIDSTHRSDHAIEAATLLAEALESEIAGLFVEDSDLIAAASLPFTRMTTPFGGLALDVTGDSVAGELKQQADVARRSLRRLSENRRVKWSFETRRGRMDREIRASAQATDIVCLCSVESLKGSSQVENAAATLLGFPRRDLSAGDIVVLIDDPDLGEPAIEIAARLALRNRRKLKIVLIAAAAQVPGPYRPLTERLSDEGISVDIVVCEDCDPYRLLDAIGKSPVGFFISGIRTVTAPGWIKACSATFRCPVLVLKG
jgi:nucleotide-binding universal stress UspA family protein